MRSTARSDSQVPGRVSGVFMVLPLFALAVFVPQPEPPPGAKPEALLELLGAFYSKNWPAYLAAALVNLWVGVNRAGYSLLQEMPFFSLVFGLPAAFALLLFLAGGHGVALSYLVLQALGRLRHHADFVAHVGMRNGDHALDSVRLEHRAWHNDSNCAERHVRRLHGKERDACLIPGLHARRNAVQCFPCACYMVFPLAHCTPRYTSTESK